MMTGLWAGCSARSSETLQRTSLDAKLGERGEDWRSLLGLLASYQRAKVEGVEGGYHLCCCLMYVHVPPFTSNLGTR